MSRDYRFPDRFLWGAATSAYQIVGSPLADGAGPDTRTYRVSFAKVAEYQVRGVVHFHAIIRLDGPPIDENLYPAPLVDVDSTWLGDRTREAVTSVEFRLL